MDQETLTSLLKLATPIFTDAKYLAASIDQFDGHRNVHISKDGAKAMLLNYQRVLETLAGLTGKVAGAEADQRPTKPSPIQRLETLRMTSLERLESLHQTLSQGLTQ